MDFKFINLIVWYMDIWLNERRIINTLHCHQYDEGTEIIDKFIFSCFILKVNCNILVRLVIDELTSAEVISDY